MDYRTYGKCLAIGGSLQINEWQTRLFLIDSTTGLLLNELISGREGLKKYYNNSFSIYIQKCLSKNLKAREKEYYYFKNKMDEQQTKINYIKKIINIWRKK